MVLLLKESDVCSLIDMRKALSALEEAFREQSESQVISPDRQVIQTEKSSAIVRIMAAAAPRLQALGLKVLLGIPSKRRNNRTYFSTMLFDPDDGSLIAIMSEARLTQLRTGAASAIATKYLMAPRSTKLGLAGAGVQGYGQLEGVATVVNLSEVLIFDLDQDRAELLVKECKSKFGLDALCVSSVHDLSQADIISTATTSTEPIIERVRPGTHINAIGSNAPNRREIHESILTQSRVIVDKKEQALRESGDLVIPIRKGLYRNEYIAGELCDVVSGKIIGRTSNSDITLFKSVGIALEDIAVSRAVYELAVEKGLGEEFSFHQ